MKHVRPVSAPRPQYATLIGGGTGTAVTDLILTIKAALVDFRFAKNNQVITGS
jgi:hypothetical protein